MMPDKVTAEQGGAIAKAACLAQVLASPTRLKLLKLIQADELCVCELALLLGVSQPAISQHLAKLREAGLVVERRDGAMSLFRAADVADKIRAEVLTVLDVPARQLEEMAPHLSRLPEAHARRSCGREVQPEQPCPKE
jgi:ArsR family transcriptional regulator